MEELGLKEETLSLRWEAKAKGQCEAETFVNWRVKIVLGLSSAAYTTPNNHCLHIQCLELAVHSWYGSSMPAHTSSVQFCYPHHIWLLSYRSLMVSSWLLIFSPSFPCSNLVKRRWCREGDFQGLFL